MKHEHLRILVVLPLYGGSLPIGYYCAQALKNIGQNVRIYESPLFFEAFSGIKKLNLDPERISYLEKSFLRLVSQGIWQMAEEQSPHILLAMAQAPIDKLLLQKLKQTSIRSVMWFVEDYRLFPYWRYYAPLYDAFAVIQKEPFLAELATIGQKHAFYLPLAALPSFHKPLKLTDVEKAVYGSDLSFLGAGYPNRRKIFREFADMDFKIWGSDWDEEEALKNHIQRNGERIGSEESVKIFNAAKINLNLHSSVDPDQQVAQGDFVNPRTFELASAGAFQLVDRRSLMNELFTDSELAIFDSVKEMNDKAAYFLANPEEREKYAKLARERVLRDHTYEKRMDTLLEYMTENFGSYKDIGVGKKILDELPENFKKDIEELLKRLNLPMDASFGEVISSIREQQGALSGMETILLFLDEFKKQYKF